MTTLVPKGVRDSAWTQLLPQRNYAVLCKPDESVFFKFGQGHGMYMSIDPTSSGRLVNSIDFENGDPSLLGKLPADSKIVIGRTGESNIKVMHAMISRQHLEMELKGYVLVVRDLGSTNGTYVLSEIPHFDIEDYIEHHPNGASVSDTLNWVQESFGVEIEEFLKSYSQSKKEIN